MRAQKETKTIKCKRKIIYCSAFILMMAALGTLTYAAYQFISLPPWLDPATNWLKARLGEYQDIWASGLLVLFWDWARRFATAVCRRFGLSLERTQKELLTRADNHQTTLSTKSLIVGKEGMQYICPSLYLFLSYIYGASIFTSQGKFDGTFLIPAFVFAVSTVCAVLSLIQIRQPFILADVRGIRYSGFFALFSKFISWKQIYSCEITTKYDVFGSPKFSIILRNAKHKKLLTIDPTTGTVAAGYRNTKRIQKFIGMALSSELTKNTFP